MARTAAGSRSGMDEYELHGHLSEKIFRAIGNYFENLSSSVGSISEEIYSRQAVYFSYTSTMLEDYMLDQNLMGDLTDEARFVTKLDLSRIGARVGIDLYFMTGDTRYLNIGYDLAFEDDDPFVNAAQLLVAATGFTPGRAQAELNWYSQERAYPLSYLVGNHLVWQLKRDYQQAAGKQMSPDELDRNFHRIYLESGNMPVAQLRRVFEHELGQSL